MLLTPPGTTLLKTLGAGATFEAALVRGSPMAPRGDHEPGIFVVKRPVPRLIDRPEGALALGREWEILSALPASTLPEPLFRGQDAQSPYLAQTLAKGVSLRQLREQARLPPLLFHRIARTSSQALAELHECTDARGPLGFVHGDLSPDNVFFDVAANRVTFIDFATSIWRDGAIPIFPSSRGTLPFAAPELAREESRPSAATDTYALAAILAFLLVDSLTDAPGEAAMLAEVGERGLRLDRLADCSDLPGRSLNAIRHALAFNKDDRLADSRELARELQAGTAAV